MSKSIWDIRFNNHDVAQDAEGDEGQWITVNGAHVHINGEGVIDAGAGGAFTGQKLSDVGKHSTKDKIKTEKTSRRERKAKEIQAAKPLIARMKKSNEAALKILNSLPRPSGENQIKPEDVKNRKDYQDFISQYGLKDTYSLESKFASSHHHVYSDVAKNIESAVNNVYDDLKGYIERDSCFKFDNPKHPLKEWPLDIVDIPRMALGTKQDFDNAHLNGRKSANRYTDRELFNDMREHEKKYGTNLGYGEYKKKKYK